MNDRSIITVSPGLLGALSNGQLDIDVFKKETLVMECLVAGTSFRQLNQVDANHSAKVKLDIKREGKNEFDGFAVALYFEQT